MTEIMTRAQINDIFREHGFGDDNPIPSKVGFRNQVYLGEHAVLKVYPEDNLRGYRCERWFYESADRPYAPKLYAAGKNWLLLERIHGVGLFRYWRDISDRERYDLVRKISEIALAVSASDLTDTSAFLEYRTDFGAALLAEIESLAAKLRQMHGIEEELLSQVLDYAHRFAGVFDDTELYLVYDDLHFDNLIVTGEGRVVLLDFEMIQAAPKDLVLDVWHRMLIHPFTYANEEDDPYTRAEDYTHLLSWMRQCAPSLFSHPEVYRRVNLYGIRYELDLLCEFPMAKWPRERLRIYLSEALDQY